MDGEVKISINQEKIDWEALWDGLHGVFTNNTDLTPEEVLSHYHELWQVEESFRISKHDLRVRPVFLWNAKRIRDLILILGLWNFQQINWIEKMAERTDLEF